MGDTALLFAAVDTGDKAKALSLDRTTSGPLFEQMQQQVDGLVNEHSQEAIQRLAELDQSQHKSFTTTPIVFTIGLVLLGLCWVALRTHRRKLAEAKQTQLAQLDETARLTALQVEQQHPVNPLNN